MSKLYVVGVNFGSKSAGVLFHKHQLCALARFFSSTNEPQLSEIDKEIIKRHKRACDLEQKFYEDPETGNNVMTSYQHHKRNRCCGSACRHVSHLFT